MQAHTQVFFHRTQWGEIHTVIRLNKKKKIVYAYNNIDQSSENKYKQYKYKLVWYLVESYQSTTTHRASKPFS